MSDGIMPYMAGGKSYAQMMKKMGKPAISGSISKSIRKMRLERGKKKPK